MSNIIDRTLDLSNRHFAGDIYDAIEDTKRDGKGIVHVTIESLHDLFTEFEDRVNEVQELTDDLDISRGETRTWEDDYSDSQYELDEANKEIEELQNKNNSYEDDINDLNQQIEYLQSIVDTYSDGD